MQKRGSCYLTKAFCFCPELLPDTEGGHVSCTKQEGAVLISSAFLLMRSSSYGRNIIQHDKPRGAMIIIIAIMYGRRTADSLSYAYVAAYLGRP